MNIPADHQMNNTDPLTMQAPQTGKTELTQSKPSRDHVKRIPLHYPKRAKWQSLIEAYYSS